jgi:hypothetical protein
LHIDVLYGEFAWDKWFKNVRVVIANKIPYCFHHKKLNDFIGGGYVAKARSTGNVSKYPINGYANNPIYGPLRLIESIQTV